MSKSTADPIVIELTAIRLFCEPSIPYDATPDDRARIVAKQEKDWREEVTAEVREKFRLKAAIVLELLSADGVAFRAGRGAEAALHSAITIPAHIAYELPRVADPAPPNADAITA